MSAPVSTTQQARAVLAAAGQLLDYPDAAWFAELPALAATLEGLPAGPAAEALRAFAAAAQDSDPRAFETRYVNTFDFSNKTSLYLTSRARADAGIQHMDLIAYSVYFEESGYEAPNDLPDYLVALLELASVVDDAQLERMLRGMEDDLKLLYEALVEAGIDDYANVIAAVRETGRAVTQEVAG